MWLCLLIACPLPLPDLLHDILCATLRAGSVCLDVINQTWSPMFGMSSGVDGLFLL